MNEILTFSLVAFLLVISPGPNGVLIIKTISAKGTKAAIYNILGLFIATFFHGAFSILGLSALVLQSAELFIVIKIVGALYLLYIGLKAIINTFNKQADSKINTELNTNNITDNNFKKSHYFIEGFLTQILNPKVSMFYLAAFPQFLSFEDPSVFNAFVLVSIHASIIFIWFTLLSKSIHKINLSARLPNLGKWVQRISGSIMIYFAGLLLAFR